MDDDALLGVLNEAADAAVDAVGKTSDFSLTGAEHEQHAADVAADNAALAVLSAAGLSVVSEESGHHDGDAITVVVDPLDGSSNAAQGLPWFASSLCAVREGEATVALVVDHASGARYEAVRGSGARRDGEAINPSNVERLDRAFVSLTDLPPRHLGWRQFRAYGAIALDLCAVAEGRFDAVIDCGRSAHAPWDYLGGMLVCREAGAVVVDALDRPLDTADGAQRRTVLAAATPALLQLVGEARSVFPA